MILCLGAEGSIKEAGREEERPHQQEQQGGQGQPQAGGAGRGHQESGRAEGQTQKLPQAGQRGQGGEEGEKIIMNTRQSSKKICRYKQSHRCFFVNVFFPMFWLL